MGGDMPERCAERQAIADWSEEKSEAWAVTTTPRREDERAAQKYHTQAQGCGVLCSRSHYKSMRKCGCCESFTENSTTTTVFGGFS
jgi:hypothetical protein